MTLTRLAATLLLAAFGHLTYAQQPEAFGFSSERLNRLHAAMQAQIDQKQLSGIVTLLARHGKVVEEKAYGQEDLANGAPMTTDTIFRIYSMTKPVTGVAMMMLYEEGKWRPSDPISKFIPEFAHLKVFKGFGADGKIILEDPVHPPTMKELMTHTAGFTYGIFGGGPVNQMYVDQKVLGSHNLQDMIEKLAAIPLMYQPGTRWVYSVSMDIQGYLVEKFSGQSLPDFFEQRIFKPLRMKDTSFFVPREKRNRFATMYNGNDKGEMVVAGEATGPHADYTTLPGMPMGGGGLVSTAEDYLSFAQMLLNHGELDGVRLLGPATVDLMTANHLAPSLMTGEFSIGHMVIRPGLGWGYDCAVFADPLTADEIVGKGTFYWAGAADTWFWVDPTNDLIFIGMTQRLMGPGQPNMEQFSRPEVYQALINPRK